jgi:hypothetical protein
MRSLLVRFYPARWRERYGDEFLAILEERPLGPFDLADILLGALDARLRQGRGSDLTTERRFTMSLRIGGIAAIVGAPLWTVGFLIANDVLLAGNSRAAALLVVAGSLALLVALAALSAFQARVRPLLSWAAFALPAIGTIGLVFGAAATFLGRPGFEDAFYFGLMAFLLGSLLFAIASIFTAGFSRIGPILFGAATLLVFAAGGGEESRELLNIAALAVFTLGWVALGAQAIRLDRPIATATPA